MSLLSSLLSGSKLNDGWNELESLDGLDRAVEESNDKPVVLFKHSVTCGISAYAKSRLEELKIHDGFKFYYLDLLSFRNISNEIASRFGVIHQSPQIIVLKGGKSVFTTSHHAITADAIENHLN